MVSRMRSSARTRIERIYFPGNASNYITQDGIQLGDKVVLCYRVSTSQQERTRNHVAQELYLRAEVIARGAIIIDVVPYVGSGFEPYWVSDAAYIAKQHKAKIVVITTDRLIRHPYFKSTGDEYERNARANIEGLEDLKRYADGVELVTLLNPDAPLVECMALLKRIGQHYKNRKGGRPKKKIPGIMKERRLQMEPKVIELHKAGHSIREIVGILGIPRATVCDWINAQKDQPQ